MLHLSKYMHDHMWDARVGTFTDRRLKAVYGPQAAAAGSQPPMASPSNAAAGHGAAAAASSSAISSQQSQLQPLTEHSDVRSIGAYWTLLAGTVAAERLDPFTAHLDDPATFNRINRVPSLSASHPQYQESGEWPRRASDGSEVSTVNH